MAVFENQPQNETSFDDSLPLSCVFQQHRIVDGHAEYIIKVQRGSSKANSWTIFKRYREFEALDKELQAASFDISLPGKKLLGNLSTQFILQRQDLLQTYMNKILSNLVLASSIHVKRFLDSDNYSPTFQDTAFQFASMAVRGKPSFHDLKPLPNIGWRYNKQYCKIKKYDCRREFVVTWISEYGNRKCLNDKELQSTFKVLTELSHPFIVSIVIGNFSPTGTLIIRPDCTEGSLRELIYERSRFDNFIQKCRYRRERLIMPADAVSTISVQILHALAFLHHKKIPYGNLHCGNVFIEDDVAKISDVENSIFDLASFYKPYIIENRRIHSIQDVDVYCFGHVLYEMAFGERLQSFYCDSIPSDCYENLRPVLHLLLTSSMEQPLPSVSEVLVFEAFELCSSNVVFREKPRVKMSSHARELFQRCQKSVETRIKNEQNELRRHRKITHLQEQVESEEKCEYTGKKATRNGNARMKKMSSQSSLRANISEQCENRSNSSTTTLNTDSSPSTSICDKTNTTPNRDTLEPGDRIASSLPEVPEQDNRSQLLQSIVSFNKHNLKKISSNS